MVSRTETKVEIRVETSSDTVMLCVTAPPSLHSLKTQRLTPEGSP